MAGHPIVIFGAGATKACSGTEPMDENFEEKLVQIIRSNAWFMKVLETVAACNLPDWCVGAGAIRNIVWDHLHGYTQPSHLTNVDRCAKLKQDLWRSAPWLGPGGNQRCARTQQRTARP